VIFAMQLLCVAGVWPDFYKIVPLMMAFKEEPSIEAVFVHTGKYERLGQFFFDELHIPKPDIHLNVGAGSATVQIASIMMRFEPIVLKFKPDYVLVVGDSDSAVACGLAAVNCRSKLIHVEAGLRCFDRTRHDENNRILVDSISDLLFASEPSGVGNLLREGEYPSNIYFIGNAMVDTLLACKEKIDRSDILGRLRLEKRQYAVLSLQQTTNIDNRETFREITEALEVIGKTLKIIFPFLPQIKKNSIGLKQYQSMSSIENLTFVSHLGYLDYLCLLRNARLSITDSDCVQEETTILNVPCITLSENTERQATITHGTNRLVHADAEAITMNYLDIILNWSADMHTMPESWDGMAAKRIALIVSGQWD